MAALVIRTGAGPNDLLAAPPGVLLAIEQQLEKQDKEERRQQRMGKMRDRLQSARAKGG